MARTNWSEKAPGTLGKIGKAHHVRIEAAKAWQAAKARRDERRAKRKAQVNAIRSMAFNPIRGLEKLEA